MGYLTSWLLVLMVTFGCFVKAYRMAALLFKARAAHWIRLTEGMDLSELPLRICNAVTH
jgi:hypothetical protein